MRVWIFCFTLSAFSVIAAPLLSRVQPMAVPPGKTIDLQLDGDRFSDLLQITTTFPAKTELVKRTNDKQVIIRITVPPTVETSAGLTSLTVGSGL